MTHIPTPIRIDRQEHIVNSLVPNTNGVLENKGKIARQYITMTSAYDGEDYIPKLIKDLEATLDMLKLYQQELELDKAIKRRSYERQS